MTFFRTGSLAYLGWLVLSAHAQQPARLDVWAVDPLTKVFRDAKPEAPADTVAEVARGETASFQLVVRCEAAIEKLRATCTPFAPMAQTAPSQSRLGSDAAAATQPARLKPSAVRFVGYVPVDRPVQTPAADLLRKPPAEYPDPLLEVESLDVPAGAAQPIWVTVLIPANAAPGDWQATLDVVGRVAGSEVKASANLKLHIYSATIGRSRLWVTNWFAMHALHMSVTPAAYSAEYWQLLRRYARNMAAHRQNVALAAPLSLAEFKARPDGSFDIDFARFDQWVQIFIDEGVIGRIEGGHFGGRVGNWESPFAVTINEIKDGKVAARNVDPASAEADGFYGRFLPALVAHLKEKGWLDKYVQHLADEPIGENAASYRAIAALLHKYAPELRIIEACHTKDLVGAINVWVPQLNFLHRDFDHYQARQKAGEEVWFYTCVFPQGEYANRFIELPLLKTRLLHWINYRYGVTGYLHWGYNQWVAEDPFKQPIREGLPAGDSWIVYPGKDGPLDSIRWETMRDGIADHELLCLLAERNAEQAQTLAQRHVLNFDKYNCDVQAFRQTRRELLERLSKP